MKTLPTALNLIIGRIYKATRDAHTKNAGDLYYKPIERLNETYYRLAVYGAKNPKRPATTRVSAVESLLSHRLALMDFSEEPKAFRSEEGKAWAEQKARDEREAAAAARKAALASRKPSPESTPEPKQKGESGPSGKPYPRPASVFFSAETYDQIEAFRVAQQAEADARGDGAEVSMTEAIRRLVRIGLITLQTRSEAKAPSVSPPYATANGFFSS